MATIRSALPSGQHGREACVSAVTRFLSRQPSAPRLVGPTGAAKILGVKPPHLAPLRKKGRMPEPIEVEQGGGMGIVYLREDIEELARELHAERKQGVKKEEKDD